MDCSAKRSCCQARGSANVHEALTQAISSLGISAPVKSVGCVGMCHQTPLVEVITGEGDSHLYAVVKPEDARAILLRHFKPRGLIRTVGAALSSSLEKLLTDESWEPVTRYSIEVRDPPVTAFLGKQKNIATEYCGFLDPLDLDQYFQCDGFKALKRCLTELSPEEVIATVAESKSQ